MRVESLFNQARGMVKGLYSLAMDDWGFRAEQAFAYAQDDLELLLGKDAPGPNAILQTAIYMEGHRRGLKLSKEDSYTSNMLDTLARTYSKCSVESLLEADVDDEELRIIQSDMETVRKLFLL